MDRRSVLTALSALAASACSPGGSASAAPEPSSPEAATPVTESLDLSGLEPAGARLGFAAWDVASGRRLAWRGDERFVYCSTFKLFLAAATLARVQAGQERLDREIAVTAADMIPHAPTTGPAVGGTLTVEALMKGTVELSDNPAANLLLREMGGLEAMQGFYRSLGDAVTRVDRWEPEMNRLDGDKDTTTPLAALGDLHRLFVAPDTPLDASSAALLKRWLIDTPTGANRLKAGVPAGWTVAHKTGTGGYGPTNDIGLAYPPQGAPVILTAYYHATPESPEAGREEVIAQAVRASLRVLGHG